MMGWANVFFIEPRRESYCTLRLREREAPTASVRCTVGSAVAVLLLYVTMKYNGREVQQNGLLSRVPGLPGLRTRAFCGGSWGDGVCLNYDHFGSHAPWKRPLYVTWVVAVQLRSLSAGVLCAV